MTVGVPFASSVDIVMSLGTVRFGAVVSAGAIVMLPCIQLGAVGCNLS